MDRAVLRDDMVASLEDETKAILHDERVSLAMRRVPRHEFVEDDRSAYEDTALRHRGTRVLAPSEVARMLEALTPAEGDSILVVGAGVGYTVAVLAELAGAEHVHAVDITRSLVLDARANLARAGYPGVLVDCRDGAKGLPEYAPFDRILVEAAGVRPPRPLLDQLTDDGRLVMPLGTGEQSLAAVEAGDVVERFGPVAFDPLLVDGEQAEAVERNRTAREDREYAERRARSRRGWEQEWIDWDRVV